MAARLRDRSARTRREGYSTRYPWTLQPVSKIVGQRPWEFVCRKAWRAPPMRFSNGISAVTSLCLCDEASTGGPSLLIAGDEDGGISVVKVDEGSEDSSSSEARLPTPELGRGRVRLHSSCVNTIKVLPDQRGYVCAGDDGALSAVASFEADTKSATLHLTGHSSFVTDCDVAETGHCILSSSSDGRMLLWDPVASNAPVASVLVGPAVNSACFSAGDPYALLCAPQLGIGGGGAVGSGSRSGGSGGGKDCDDLVQIWDLRFLRSFKDSIPAALAAAFGEDKNVSSPELGSMAPPPPQSPQVWTSSIWAGNGDGSAGSSVTQGQSRVPRTPGQVPSWLSSALGSRLAASPATPLLRRSEWSDYSTNSGSSDADSSFSSDERRHQGGTSWLRDTGHTPGTTSTSTSSSKSTPGSAGEEKPFLFPSPSNSSTCSTSTASATSGDTEYASTPCSTRKHDTAPPPPRSNRTVRDGHGPSATLRLADLPPSCCLHQETRGRGKTWIPGGLKTWQPGGRRGRAAGARDGAGATCRLCSSLSARTASSVQVSSDGKGILVASQDRTVTFFDAQSREAVYRFSHPKLSTRARPLLLESGSRDGAGGWGRSSSGGGRGDVFGGMMEGEVRCWRVGSQFPNRVFKPAGHHVGFEVCCLAMSRNGAMFASADSRGVVCVQSATSNRYPPQAHGDGNGDGEGYRED